MGATAGTQVLATTPPRPRSDSWAARRLSRNTFQSSDMPRRTRLHQHSRQTRSRGRSAPLGYLAALALIWSCAVFQKGATNDRDWIVCMFAIGALTLLYWARTPRRELAPALPRWTSLPLALLLGVMVLQLVPLPAPLLDGISPARAELRNSLAAAASPGWSSASVAPAKTVFHLVRFLGCIATLLLARELTWRLRLNNWMVAVPLVLVASLEGLLAVIQTTVQPSRLGVSGTYVNHNHLAGMLELSLPFSLAVVAVLLKRIRSDRPPGGVLTAKAAAGVAGAALVFAGLLCSFSRAGFVAALISVAVMAALALTARGTSRARIAAALAAILFLAAAFFLLLPDGFIVRYAGVASTDGLLREGRVSLWSETLDLVRAYPLLGCGFGAYQSAFYQFKRSWPQVTDDYAHNDYLQLLAELGPLGLLSGLWLVAGILAGVIAARRDLPHPSLPVALACAGSLVAIGIHSAADFNLYIPANSMQFAWILGIASALPLLSAGQKRGLPDAPRVDGAGQGAVRLAS